MKEKITNTITSFKEFFKVSSEFSMNRLMVFSCGLSSFILSILAFFLAYKDKLTLEYVGLVVSIWAATFGGKNWSKNIEMKFGNKKDDNGFKEG